MRRATLAASRDFGEHDDLRLTDLGEGALDALRGAGNYLSELATPALRLGVTGLARSGKTVFITALIRNLTAGGRLPFFTPFAEGRVLLIPIASTPAPAASTTQPAATPTLAATLTLTPASP